ncbi:DUF6695 family protein [Ichthyenterobacterium magnum]|uniref:Uncharacterized protein n=1 Tax=Ichthyenterobacterium magnum TaxID=1230530 RepID=A0A420DVT7_9FLAO|nr:DUF6695 family protein [Ichthyenterobacterium magnum]RKE98330.1 hypothetical protein BXY80_0413 [Ichthyenterobacterium magnum]
MINNGIILTLAYPDTVVMISDEWYLSYLRFLGVGKKNYIRAGHAALVLIDKSTGELEYHDFGRYISPKSNGRVRGKTTDYELEFPMKAKLKGDKIENLNEVLVFLATNPQLTHGEGKLIASVCSSINYEKAKAYISTLQDLYFIKYAAFKKGATNCSRFVTDTLIASVTNKTIKKALIKSKWFTPSTIGNVLIVNTEKKVYSVSEQGNISEFKGSKQSENIRCFLDRLKDYEPKLEGSLEPIAISGVADKAQWLSGIGAGAWFELHDINHDKEFRFRRISPFGNVDVDGVYKLFNLGFDIAKEYSFIKNSNCNFFHVKQQHVVYRFDFLREFK